MLPDFGDNAPFIWAIYVIGLAVPVGLAVYCGMRARLARRRLERLQGEGRS